MSKVQSTLKMFKLLWLLFTLQIRYPSKKPINNIQTLYFIVKIDITFFCQNWNKNYHTDQLSFCFGTPKQEPCTQGKLLAQSHLVWFVRKYMSAKTC